MSLKQNWQKSVDENYECFNDTFYDELEVGNKTVGNELSMGLNNVFFGDIQGVNIPVFIS